MIASLERSLAHMVRMLALPYDKPSPLAPSLRRLTPDSFVDRDPRTRLRSPCPVGTERSAAWLPRHLKPFGRLFEGRRHRTRTQSGAQPGRESRLRDHAVVSAVGSPAARIFVGRVLRDSASIGASVVQPTKAATDDGGYSKKLPSSTVSPAPSSGPLMKPSPSLSPVPGSECVSASALPIRIPVRRSSPPQLP